MSKTFYVILPSDTRDPPDNRTNKFTVRLPKTLNFNSMWLCGLSSIIYPHSYAAIGTTRDQYIYVLVNDGRYHWPYSLIRVKFPKGSFVTPQALTKKLNLVVAEAADKLEAEWHKSAYYRGRQKRSVVEEVEQELDDREDSAKPADKKSKPDAEIDDREAEDDLEERRRRDQWAHIHTIHAPGPHPIRYELYRDNKDKLIVPNYHGKTVSLSSKAQKPTPTEIREQRLYMRSYTAPNGKLVEVYYNPKGDIAHVSVRNQPPPPPGPTPPPPRTPSPTPTPPPPPPPPSSPPKKDKDQAETEVDDRDSEKKKSSSPPPSSPKPEEKEPELEDKEPEEKKPVKEQPSSELEEDKEDRDDGPKTRPTDFLLGLELERFGSATVTVDFETGVSESPRTDEVAYGIIYGESKRTYMEQKHHHHHDILRGIRFEYDEEKQRYRMSFKHHSLEYCYFTPQLAYTLGFSEEKNYVNGAMASHPPDLGGGIHHLYVYASNLTENIIVGDKMASLLRIVTIRGESGQMIEETYNTPIMSRVVNNDLNEIGIEIRTADGRLFPFEWGTVHLVLVFKKAIYL